MQNNISRCVTWLWNTNSHINGGTQAKGIWKLDPETNIWAQNGWAWGVKKALLLSLYHSLNKVMLIKSRRLRWTGRISRMEEGISIFKTWIDKPIKRRPLERLIIWTLVMKALVNSLFGSFVYEDSHIAQNNMNNNKNNTLVLQSTEGQGLSNDFWHIHLSSDRVIRSSSQFTGDIYSAHRVPQPLLAF